MLIRLKKKCSIFITQFLLQKDRCFGSKYYISDFINLLIANIILAQHFIIATCKLVEKLLLKKPKY